MRERPSWLEPRWHLERARVPGTRSVDVEIIVNGRVAATRRIVADGSSQPIEADLDIADSSWVCLRIRPSLHANPVFVLVADKPIRASRASAEWCLGSLAKLEATQLPQIEASEREAARAAYARARARFERIRAECRS